MAAQSHFMEVDLPKLWWGHDVGETLCATHDATKSYNGGATCGRCVANHRVSQSQLLLQKTLV